MFHAGQQQPAVVESCDVEDAGLLSADHPCAEVGLKAPVVLVAVLDERKVCHLRSDVAEGDAGGLAWSGLVGVGG